jgi:UDP-N-acetylmuramate dehydrogenase
MGVGSNLIVRDGGIEGVVIRLGRGFNAVRIEGDTVIAGAAALDAQVAKRAAEAGRDLTFLRTIPGSIGGALRMNAGCYGTYVADHFAGAEAVLRDGTKITLAPEDITFAYRHTDLPEDAVITEVRFTAPEGDPEALEARMAEQLAKRDATQPTKDRTAGSTFRNPAGFSSTGRADDTHESEGVEGDRRRRDARRDAGRGADVADAFQLSRQYRGRNRCRPRRIGRRGAKKGFRDQRNNARVGNQADRSVQAD